MPMHWEYYYHNWNMPFFGAFTLALFGALLFLLVVWSLVWKGMALWKAAQAKDKVWFVILLLVNTAGILEILYLYVFSKRKKSESTDASH